MANKCLGHELRQTRQNHICRLLALPEVNPPDQNLRISIKSRQGSIETSLKNLEDIYKKKPEWEVIEEGGIWSVPVEELRMQNPLRPGARGKLDFEKRRAGEQQIEGYSVAETIEHLNAKILTKYNNCFCINHQNCNG